MERERDKKPLPSPPPAGNNRQSNILSGPARPFQVRQASLGRSPVTKHYARERGLGAHPKADPRKACSSKPRSHVSVGTSLTGGRAGTVG